jgi:hypothetical protein
MSTYNKNCSRVIRVCGNEISIHGHLSNFCQKYHFQILSPLQSLLYSFTVTNSMLIFMSRYRLRLSYKALSPSERWRDISPPRQGSAATGVRWVVLLVGLLKLSSASKIRNLASCRGRCIIGIHVGDLEGQVRR